MDLPYKVFYIESTFLKPKRKRRVDGFTMSKELEALLTEQSNKGYELFSIVPLDGNTVGIETIVSTTGLMVTFKQKEG